MQTTWYNFYMSDKTTNCIENYPTSVMNDISSGINNLPIAELYRELFVNEVELFSYIQQYTSLQYPLLLASVQFYEKMTSGAYRDSVCKYADHICLTTGATGAISALFEYISGTTPYSPIILLGYHYYLYSTLATRFCLPYKTLVAPSEIRNLPYLSQIEQEFLNNQAKYIFLTTPANPSGELYSEIEMRQLLQLITKYDKVLVIDKCLWDDVVFRNKPNYYSLSQLIVEEKISEHIVIIHSFSKTRGVPGIRFGYIMGSTDLINFVQYYCEKQICMNHLTYITPVVVDLFFQTIINCAELGLDLLTKKFRHIIMQSMEELTVQKFLLNFVKPCTNNLRKYETLLIENDLQMQKNYCMTIQIFANNQNVHFTSLVTGFNFCLIYNNPNNLLESDVKRILVQELNSRIFTQENFCSTEPRNSIWFRLSCAEITPNYFEKLIHLNKLLNILSGNRYMILYD